MRSETEAMRALEQYADTIRRICFLHLKNRADVEDVFQEVFLKYILYERSFESDAHEKAWLIRVAVNQCKGNIYRVMRTISRAGYGCVLFHCAAGKDCTGIIAMLLLLLAGVPDDIIAADYASSCDNMAVVFARQKLLAHAAGRPVNEALYRSSRADITVAMAHLYGHYGSAENYLASISCSETEIAALRRVLLGAAFKAAG